jgi:hypothetical protein
MPMPPPKPSVEGHRDRHVAHEMGQIVRALTVNGPQHPADLARLLGAEYWEPGRFDTALAFAVTDGVVHRSADGTVAVSTPL